MRERAARITREVEQLARVQVAEPPQQRTRPEHRSDDADDLDVRVRLSSVHPHERAAQAVPRGGETYPE